MTWEWDSATNYLLSGVRLLLCFRRKRRHFHATLLTQIWLQGHCIHPSGTAIKTPTCGCVLFFVLFFLLHLCSFSLTLNSPLTRDLRYFPPACTLSALHSSFLLQSAVKNQERLITVAYINVWLFIPPRSHSSAPGSHISISPALCKYLKVGLKN